MKRILSLVLSIIMMFSLCACGNNEKAEKYCWSCGEGISKKVAFCEHCGAAVNNTENRNDESSGNITSANESTVSTLSSSTQNPARPETQLHSHSYSKKVTAATCTTKGFTTYICSCGHSYKDSYTDPSHTYKNYKCSSCGQLDKTYTFDILVDWVLEHGKTSDDYCIVEYTDSAAIIYQKSYNCIYLQNSWFDIYNPEDDSVFINYIQITDDMTSSYYFYSSMEISDNLVSEFDGYLDSKTFTKNTLLKCNTFINNTSLSKKEMLQMQAELYTEMLKSVNKMLAGEYDGTENSGLNIGDLGFEAIS